jgi:hypothetical protein
MKMRVRFIEVISKVIGGGAGYRYVSWKRSAELAERRWQRPERQTTAPDAAARTPIGRLTPSAMTIAVIVGPAVMMPVMDDVRSADDTTDNATGDCANGPGNNGAGARADSGTFQRSRLGRDRGCGQHQDE